MPIRKSRAEVIKAALHRLIFGETGIICLQSKLRSELMIRNASTLTARHIDVNDKFTNLEMFIILLKEIYASNIN